MVKALTLGSRRSKVETPVGARLVPILMRFVDVLPATENNGYQWCLVYKNMILSYKSVS